jgi:hypothetical protein
MKKKIICVIIILLITPVICFSLIKAYNNKINNHDNTDLHNKEAKSSSFINEENKLIYSFPVNKENSAGYEPAKEHEEIRPDAFCISGNNLFIDDTVNSRIIVYDNGVYKKKIELQNNMDAILMFYDYTNDRLKIVYEDLYREDGTDLYLYMTSVCVSEDNKTEKGKKICKNNKIPINYCFDMDGNLITEYLGEPASLAYIDEMQINRDVLTLGDSISYDLCTTYENKQGGGIVTEYILKNDLENAGIYAVPENHKDALGRGNIQVTKEGKIYQMVVDLTGIRIYQLCERTDGMAEHNKLVRTVGNINEDYKENTKNNKNKLIYSFPHNEENTETRPDAFCISGNSLFIDDNLNGRIIVYDNGIYKKEIKLQSGMDVKLLYYDSQNDNLKMVYEDLSRQDDRDLYLYMASVHVSKDSKAKKGDIICKNNEMPLFYCFDVDGNLVTQYPKEPGTLSYIDEWAVNRDVLLSGDGISYELCTTCAGIPGKDAGKYVIREYILKDGVKDGCVYAIPEKHEDILGRGNIQVTKEGSIYQMTVDSTGIKIYQLHEVACDNRNQAAENALERISGKIN